jgi:hypothetical protein
MILLEHALVVGLELSLLLTTILVIGGLIAPDMMVGDYPPDIREKYGPPSLRAARLRPIFAVLLFAAFLGVPLVGLCALRARLGQVSPLPAFVFSAGALLVFNIFDLIILDWLFFCTIQPPLMVLPGTEGMAGYRDYHFHFIGFLRGLGFCIVGGLVVTGLWLLTQGIIH